MRLLRRIRRPTTLLLLLLSLSGGRIVTVCDACEHDRVVFSPSLGFKSIVKAALRREWGRGAPHSLGERAVHYCARDLELQRRRSGPAAVVVVPPSAVPVEGEPHPERLLAFKLPSDATPVEPRHLHSKN